MGVLAERGPEWVSPYTLPMMIPNMVAGHIAMEWGIRGYSSCPVTACSASAHAIGEGLDLIRAGRADAVVCGGAEAAGDPRRGRRVRGNEGAVDPQRRPGAGVAAL